MSSYNLMNNDVRMVFKIPVSSIKKKKWWQFWKKDIDPEQELLKSIKMYWFPIRALNRKDKIEKIITKINEQK